MPSNERLDDLQLNGYYIYQDPEYFCFGTDAVCLSDFARVKKGDRVLDLCTGNGIIPILLCGKTKAAHITGMEIQPYGVELALRSVEYNGLSDKVNIVCGDINDGPSLLGASSYEVVTVNPPYIKKDAGLLNESDPVGIARHEVKCCLEDVIRVSARMLKPKGRFYMINRPQRLADAICLMRDYGVEPKAMRFVHSYIDKPPVLFMIEGLRGGGRMTKILPPLVLE